MPSLSNILKYRWLDCLFILSLYLAAEKVYPLFPGIRRLLESRINLTLFLVYTLFGLLIHCLAAFIKVSFVCTLLTNDIKRPAFVDLWQRGRELFPAYLRLHLFLFLILFAIAFPFGYFLKYYSQYLYLVTARNIASMILIKLLIFAPALIIVHKETARKSLEMVSLHSLFHAPYLITIFVLIELSVLVYVLLGIEYPSLIHILRLSITFISELLYLYLLIEAVRYISQRQEANT